MKSPAKSTRILGPEQVNRKVKRMAYQIYEDNYDEKELIIAGIAERGYHLAERLAVELRDISKTKIFLERIVINKTNPLKTKKNNNLFELKLQNKAVILVDDVLNSGKTLIYALKEFLPFNLKKLRTAVLVNREHHRFPVKVNFSGLNLSTTLQELVVVEIKKEGWHVYLQ